MVGLYQQTSMDFFDLTSDVIDKTFHKTTDNAGYIDLPDSSYNPLRQQYEAARIIHHVANQQDKDYEQRICLVDVDIYAQHMDFIFGLADPLRRTALVSTYRLNNSKLQERVAKEIIHELGHLFGLGHCADQECVMHFSKTIEDTDVKKAEFCENCRRKIG